MTDFPQMLYRPGTTIKWSGLNLDCLIVEDAKAAKEAASDGWVTPDKVHDMDVEPTLLDGNAKEIEAALPDMEDDELLDLLEDEQSGKTRKGVVKAIEAEIESR